MYKVSIPLADVKANMVLADPVHIVNQHGGSMVVLPHQFRITENTVKALERIRNYNTCYVSVFSKTPPSIDSHTNLPGSLVVEQDNIELSSATPMLKEEKKEAAINGIRDLFTVAHRNSTNGSQGNMTTAYQMVKGLEPVLDELVELVTAEPRGLVHITGLRSYDEYTYHHSLSVTVLSIAIGQALGLNIKEVRRLSNSAMLHDIGKVLIPQELITKPTALTSSEFAIVKQHPEMGVKYLKREFIGNEELWDSIKFHHEKVDGTGYPNGLKAHEIPLFSRIVSVADVYDALTSFRPYREPMVPPGNAIEKIMSEAGRVFDFDVVQAFIKKIELYPVNTVLEISDKRVGVVISNRNPMRPTLRIVKSNEIVDLSSFENLHLVVTWVDM